MFQLCIILVSVVLLTDCKATGNDTEATGNDIEATGIYIEASGNDAEASDIDDLVNQVEDLKKKLKNLSKYNKTFKLFLNLVNVMWYTRITNSSTLSVLAEIRKIEK